MRMYEISAFITETLVGSTAVDTVAETELNSTLFYYTHEDYHRMEKLNFPYCHSFCYSKNISTDRTVFIVALEVSALRVDSETTSRTSTEKTTDNMGTVVDTILQTIKDEMRSFGINTVKGFTVENVSEIIIPPRGEDDIRYMVEFEIHNKIC